VAGEVVHDDDGTRAEFGDENLLDIDFEGVAIDRSIEDPRGDDALAGNPGHEGCGLPMAMGNPAFQPLSAQTAAVAAGHVGRGPGLIDEDEALGIKSGLAVAPVLPPSDMPRYLSTEQVDRLIAACDGDVGGRRRDRAIVLLLVRLGLRAGDVAQLRFADVEWQMGSLRVCDKSRYEVRLPLPQDVGDAIAAYLECRPSTPRNDLLFLRTIASLRHTAATEMLRHGVPLDKIGLVLRHRRIDTRPITQRPTSRC